jgi:dienelactone hydrolase
MTHRFAHALPRLAPARREEVSAARRSACVALLAAALTACGGGPQPYEAEDRAKVQVSQLELRDATDRRVPIRVAYPDRGRDLPIVLFSHGAYSSKDDYAVLLDEWAAHGYVVVAPTHPDSTKLGMQRGDPAAQRTFPARLVDMKLVLDRLAEVESRVPDLAGRVARNRVAATGHSYGAMVAQTLGGATTFDPATNTTVTTGADPRISAVVLISAPGRMPPTLRAEDWRPLKVPTLVTVGTDDLAQVPGRTGYEWRREPFELVGPGDRYLLVLQGADHYLGGTIARDDAARSANGMAYVSAVNGAVLAFLDAYLKRDEDAREYLRDTNEVGEFGRLSRR